MHDRYEYVPSVSNMSQSEQDQILLATVTTIKGEKHGMVGNTFGAQNENAVGRL